MRAARVAGVAACLVLLGCRGKKPPPTVVPIEGESTVLPRVAHRPGATRVGDRSIVVGGKTRAMITVEPVTPREKLPVVLVFHGDGGGAKGFHAAFKFEEASGDEAYLLYLDGLGSTWDLETLDDNRDIAFARAAVDDLAARASIDRERIFATGYSSGGFLANVIACHLPGFLRGIASSAGGAPYKQKEKWPNGYPKCPNQRPVATLAMHGSQDFSVMTSSGRFSAQYWAYVAGCSDSEMETTGYAECNAYRKCQPGKPVVWCEIDGLGHWVWNRSAEASWTFFKRL